MTLYALKREYEERRRALLDKLQNSVLDPEVQHQIYGAVKEIENFLESIDFKIQNEQSNRLDIELERSRPRPIVERTRKAATKVRMGTRKVVKEKIPGVAKKVTAGPRRYFRRKRELKRVKREIEQEVKARMTGEPYPTTRFPDLPPMDPPAGLSGTIADVDVTSGKISVESESDFAHEEPKRVPKRGVSRKKTKRPKKPARKSAKKPSKKKSKRTRR